MILLGFHDSNDAGFIRIYIAKSILSLKHNLGGRGEEILQLESRNVTDGQWHSVRVMRDGKRFKMFLDGGGERGTMVSKIGSDAFLVARRTAECLSSIKIERLFEIILQKHLRLPQCATNAKLKLKRLSSKMITNPKKKSLFSRSTHPRAPFVSFK